MTPTSTPPAGISWIALTAEEADALTAPGYLTAFDWNLSRLGGHWLGLPNR